MSKWARSVRRESCGQQAIRYDKYRLSLQESLLSFIKGAAVCGLLSYTFYRSMNVFAAMLPVGAVAAVVLERKRLREARQLLLAHQFKESMVILSSALSSGFSMENAIAVSLEELTVIYGDNGFIVREFTSMVKQIRMNQSIEQILGDFAERSGLKDVQDLAEVFSVAKRSGGNLSEMMRHTAEVIRDKMQVQEEIRTLTASRQLEQKIMNLLPFLIVFYVECSSPGFFGQMYGTALGRLLMSICLAAYLVSYMLSKKILEIPI